MASKADAGKKIIRDTKELPDWFDLIKYQKAENLDAAAWYELFLQRWSLTFYYGYGPARVTGLGGGFEKVLEQLRSDPLHLLIDDIQIMWIGGGQLDALKCAPKMFSQFSHGISPLTIRRLYQMESRLKADSRNKIRNWIDCIFDHSNRRFEDISSSEHEWARSFIDDPIFDGLKKEGDDQRLDRSSDIVEINLALPDKILIEQFTGYLQRLRKEYPETKPASTFKYPEYKKWIEYSVLPYLDLKYWEMEQNVSIPYRVMADAIFPDGGLGEEMIRKTTKKIANQVMQKEYIDFLATIAAQEIAEKN
ncbi:MAG: hypothetical protein DI586_10865 [Micavibrio aeruginosavorus]|uniref:Uncharacterized protein n=1 Tax=Micavibrio aeruginosavorus TaxID=349221 RepID=A0A2W5FF37_9BACT|nr:MAG: hypothetical protein DI586_10865 [Micavibrio aeruginosavorus]